MKSKIGSLLLSILIAFGLWVYVITVVNPDSKITIRNIPVELEGEKILQENGLMVIKNETPTIDLQLEGNRSDLIKLNKSNITVTVDVTKIDAEGVMNAAYTIRYPGDIPDNAVTVHSQDPGMVRLVVEKYVTKYVDVELVYEGSLPTNYIVWEEDVKVLEANYAEGLQIPIVGPKSVVDTVKKAVVSVNLTNQTNTIDKKYPLVLQDANGQEVVSDALSYDHSSVKVTIPIYLTKTITPKEPIMSVPEEFEGIQLNAKVSYNAGSIIVYGPKSVVESINTNALRWNSDFVATEDNLANGTAQFSGVKVEGLPSGVKTYQESYTVTFQFDKIKRYELDSDVVNCEPENLTNQDGYEVELPGQKITVYVRSSISVENLADDDFTVKLDISEVTEKTTSVKITVSVSQPGVTVCQHPESLRITATRLAESA